MVYNCDMTYSYDENNIRYDLMLESVSKKNASSFDAFIELIRKASNSGKFNKVYRNNLGYAEMVSKIKKAWGKPIENSKFLIFENPISQYHEWFC